MLEFVTLRSEFCDTYFCVCDTHFRDLGGGENPIVNEMYLELMLFLKILESWAISIRLLSHLLPSLSREPSGGSENSVCLKDLS